MDFRWQNNAVSDRVRKDMITVFLSTQILKEYLCCTDAMFIYS